MQILVSWLIYEGIVIENGWLSAVSILTQLNAFHVAATRRKTGSVLLLGRSVMDASLA